MRGSSLVLARHLAQFAHDADLGLRGPDDVLWLARVRADLDNFRATIGWALDQEDIADQELGLSILASLSWVGESDTDLGCGTLAVRAMPLAARAAPDVRLPLLEGAAGPGARLRTPSLRRSEAWSPLRTVDEYVDTADEGRAGDARSLPSRAMTTELASNWTRWRTRFLLLTGRGGVGKTTVAATIAIALANGGERVLVVSTDPASNLGDVFGIAVGEDHPTPVTGVAGLFAMDIDPEAAAQAYRERVLSPLRGGLVPESDLDAVEEQLSGQCTVEIATFDEFSALLADPDATSGFDHVVFDTAPTGHTLRLLSLPAAWSEYIASSAQGTSCLGPLAVLDAKRALYEASVDALSDADRTTILLVSRPDRGGLREASRASGELSDLGIDNQCLVVNGLLSAPLAQDTVAEDFARRQRATLDAMPETLKRLPNITVPLVPRDLVGIDALRALSEGRIEPEDSIEWFAAPPTIDPFDVLIKELAAAGPGVIMVMGKGGVGKTTIAVAIALRLAQLDLPTHLSTTDPAGRPADLIDEPPPGLTISRIDPAVEVKRYVDEALRSTRGLDADQLALREEDLRSPCTEELAVFQAFTDLLRRGREQYVVLDTAPTGHTLLLLDNTGAYHRDVMRSRGTISGRVTTPLMRLRDPTYTRVLIVTLAETTPVNEAAALQADLRRAGVEPFGWVINASLAASGTRDPVLLRRAAMEHQHLRKVADELATRCWIVPWDTQAPG